MKAVKPVYTSRDEAEKEIAATMAAFYQSSYPQLYAEQRPLIDQAISGTREAYLENVFPDMGIQWDTYLNHLGHADYLGCFRCHDEEHETEEGAVISMDCDTCHTILAEDEENPEILKTLLGEI